MFAPPTGGRRGDPESCLNGQYSGILKRGGNPARSRNAPVRSCCPISDETRFKRRLDEAVAAKDNIPASLSLIRVDRLECVDRMHEPRRRSAVTDYVGVLLRRNLRYEDLLLRCGQHIFGVMVW